MCASDVRLAVLLAALALGCSTDPTALVIEVRSELRTPDEIDSLFIRARSGNETLFARTYELGDSPKIRLPARLALIKQGEGEGPITLELTGRSRVRLVVTRTALIRFTPGEVREVRIELSRECLGVLCPSGKTCVPRRGCASPDLDAPPAPPEPGCECGSYLPLCVGTGWTYAETGSNNVPSIKTALIQDYGRIDDPAHGKTEVTAFLQFRTLANGISRRWIRIEGQPGGRRIYWEKDQFFDIQGRLTQTTYYVPNKLRLDETRTRAGEAWPQEFQEFVVRPGVPPAPPVTYSEQWEVVAAEEQPDYPKLTFPSALCQRRSGMDSNGVKLSVQTYCFARGFGKTYERTVGGDLEILVNAEVPVCGSFGQ